MSELPTQIKIDSVSTVGGGDDGDGKTAVANQKLKPFFIDGGGGDGTAVVFDLRVCRMAIAIRTAYQFRLRLLGKISQVYINCWLINVSRL